ncbi:MAG: cation:dicarboxylase symporter family transporter [Sphingomonadaceae bacterium]|nr:cation:dicarboxylase symporter family transporter [Sphingomonadaceae bacterium]
MRRAIGGLTLAALAVGAAAGAWVRGASPAVSSTADLVGGLWLHALRLTVLPLVGPLVVTGVAGAVRTTAGAPALARSAAWMAGLLLLSAIFAAVVAPPFLAPLHALSPDHPADAAGHGVPGAAAAIRGLIAPNLVAAAASGAIAPLALFAAVLGLAATRAGERAAPFLAALDGLAGAMLVVVGWILDLAPLGVLALSFTLGEQLGAGIGAALAGYIGTQIAVTVALGVAMYAVVALTGGRVGTFARAAVTPQAIAAGTRSSLAALPAMIAAARDAGADSERAGVVLPLAVALFRLAAPASIVVVTLTVAHLNGVALGPGALASTVALAVVGTFVIAGLPNQTTFFAAYAPPVIAAGLPATLLPLFLAVDLVPDIFYTVTNVTADLALAVLASRRR